MIRFFLGLLIAFGSVGGMENPDNSLLLCVIFASAGLIMMASGARKMNQNDQF
jgi:hypothetical protein